ncbi:MAG: C10 family peptidase [Muribaculaceae bacterium]|nr:C10 family peptidase [Muribaculaceae bacterium]
MKIRFLSVMAASMTVLSAAGAPITPDKALERAGGFRPYKVYSSLAEKPKLTRTVVSDNIAAIYVFETSSGFVVLSADDETAPVLGYSEVKYDAENLPPAFESWLATLSEEIALIRDGEAAASYDAAHREEFAKIAPLCTTQWSQDAPYNDKCPKVQNDGQRCYTGCVATSMAQVMKYHEWPETGEGVSSYSWNRQILRVNYSKTSYDWSNMLDTYSEGEYSQEQADAVATLMRSCGIGVEMNYGTSASGALSGFVAPALGNYFRYDKSKLRYLLRDYYTLEEWEIMIYRSLKEDGPVILDGQSREGGHSFVCDGYDTDGFFHINWGWGGLSDGYYLLSALDPFNQGIGGSGDNSGFNFMQDAILGITPAKNDSGELVPNGEDQWYAHLFGVGDMGIDTSETYLCGDVIGDLCPDGVYNYGPSELRENTAMGLLFRSDATDEAYISFGIVGQEIGVLYGFVGFTLPIPDYMPDGTYTCTLAYCDLDYTGGGRWSMKKDVSPSTPNETPDQQDEDYDDFEIDDSRWVNVIFPQGSIQCYKAAVKNGDVVFTPSYNLPSGVESIEADAVVINGNPEYFTLQGIKITEPRPGEIVIVKKNGKVSKRIF